MLLLLESGRRGRVVVLPEPESGMALRDSWASTLSWRPKESLCGLTGCCASTTRVESSGGGGGRIETRAVRRPRRDPSALADGTRDVTGATPLERSRPGAVSTTTAAAETRRWGSRRGAHSTRCCRNGAHSRAM